MKTNTGPRAKSLRTEDDLPMSVVVGGSIALIVIMFLFLEFKPVPGTFVGAWANLAASLLVIVFGFLFVTVSSRIVGFDRELGEPCFWNDDCDADGDVGDFPGEGVDGTGVWGAGDHDWAGRCVSRLLTLETRARI